MAVHPSVDGGSEGVCASGGVGNYKAFMYCPLAWPPPGHSPSGKAEPGLEREAGEH